MENLGLLNYKTYHIILRFNSQKIIIKKLTTFTSAKIALNNQLIFLFPNILEKVILEKTEKYLSNKTVLEIDSNSDFQIFISSSSNWKSTKLKITTKIKTYTFSIQEPDKYFNKLYPFFNDKIIRG